jgi:hypothetical protein
MPVEIRELVIKTEVRTANHHAQNSMRSEDISHLKSEMLDVCKRMILEGSKRANNKR